MSLWNDGHFDVLLQEAIRCVKIFHSGCHPSFKNHTDHIIRVVKKVMLEGNVRAAVRWVTECAGGDLLNFLTVLSIPILSMG